MIFTLLLLFGEYLAADSTPGAISLRNIYIISIIWIEQQEYEKNKYFGGGSCFWVMYNEKCSKG